MRNITVFSLFAGLSLWFAFPIYAASTQAITVGQAPSTIDQSGEFEIDVLFTCGSCTGDSYLRGVFYAGGTSYFGYTQDNSGSWSNAGGSNCTSYFKVPLTDLVEGSWSGKLKLKPDIASPYFSGPGEYLFKVGRYTPSCSSASVWSAERILAITGPTPTSTPTPSPQPTHSPTPPATSTVSLMPTRTVTPTRAPTAAPATEELYLISTPSMTPLVLGDETTVISSETGIGAKPLLFASVCVSLGLAILSGVFVWMQRNKMRGQATEE